MRDVEVKREDLAKVRTPRTSREAAEAAAGAWVEWSPLAPVPARPAGVRDLQHWLDLSG